MTRMLSLCCVFCVSAALGCMIPGAQKEVHIPKAEPVAAPPPAAGLGADGIATVSFTFAPRRVQVGQTVKLMLNVPVSADVYLSGRKLSATAKDDGKVLEVTIPSGASSGYLELRVGDRSYKADARLDVEQR